MNVQFNRQEMAEALNAVCAVAAGRTPKPILQCVRVEARSDVVLLSATDLELSIRFAVSQVDVQKTGTTLVSADTFNRIVRECADELLTMNTDDQLLHVRGLGSHFQIRTQDAAEFPPIAAEEGEPDLVIDAGSLQRLIEWTIFSCARESTRYAINGVLWEQKKDTLTLAATDGRRLSVGHCTIAPKKGSDKLYAIVPVKALSVMSRISVEPDTPVSVWSVGNQLLVRLGAVSLSTALVEGQFPRYQDVIPQDSNKVAELNAEEFASALKRAALLTSEESKGVRLSFSEQELKLSSKSPEQGEAEISLPVSYKGEPLDIGFNPVFLLDGLRVIREDHVTLHLKDPQRPGVFRAGDDLTYVIMPVSI